VEESAVPLAEGSGGDLARCIVDGCGDAAALVVAGADWSMPFQSDPNFGRILAALSRSA
jgi:hypothetical protein